MQRERVVYTLLIECVLQTKEHETVTESLEEYKSRLDQTRRQLEETETRLTETEVSLEKVSHRVH